MPADSNSSADSAPSRPSREALLDAAEVAAALLKAQVRATDTKAAYTAWNQDRLRRRLASRPEGWELPMPMFALQLFVLHPTASPDSTFQPNDHPFIEALCRRGYWWVSLPSQEQASAAINMCQLFIVIISAASARDMLDGRIAPWSSVFAAAEAAAIPVFGVWLSGDTLPPPFTPHTVLDLRHTEDIDSAVGKVFPERKIVVFGERGDGSFRWMGGYKVSKLALIRRAVEYLDDTGEFFFIRLGMGHLEGDFATPGEWQRALHRPVCPEDEQIKVVGFDHFLDPNRRRLPAAGEGEKWPELRDHLRRAGDHNAKAGVNAWDRERIEERRTGREGGWREPPVIGVPRIFISYRWENLEHEAWVDSLAGALFSRGYDVIFDRHPETIDHPAGPDDSFFRIAASNMFLAVITDAYVDAVAGSAAGVTSWSAREWEEVTRLNQQGDPDDPKIIAIWRSGSRLPPGIKPENVLDARGTADIATLLDVMFPEINVILTVATKDDTFEVWPIRRRDIRGVIEGCRETFDEVRVASAKVTSAMRSNLISPREI